MKKKSEKEKRQKILTITIMLSVLILGSLISFFIYKKVNYKDDEVVMVSFGDRENKVSVNENGEVKIETPFGTFYQQWSDDKVNNFFSKFKNLDTANIGSFIGENLAIEIGFGDGDSLFFEYSEEFEDLIEELQKELEIVYEDEDEGILPEKFVPDYFFEDNLEEYGEAENNMQDQGEYSEGEDLGRGEDYDDSNDDPWQSNSGIKEDSDQFECKDIDPKTGKKIIISNMVCGE